MRQLNQRLGAVASEYWLQRLNSYKVALDHLYSGEDSLELNRLRVRYAILTWQLASDTVDRRARSQELIQTYVAMITLSERHPNECTLLCASLVRDFNGYFRQMRDSTEAFIAANSLPASAVREMRRGLDSAESMAALLARPENRGQLEMVHGMITAPMVLFYAGSDLKTLVDGLELAMRIGMMPRNMHSIPGFAMLPEEKMLESSLLDTTSKETTIRYHLTEGSDSAILRLFDAE
jgi:hypothetical protein